MRKHIAFTLFAASLSVAAQARTMQIEGQVYAGVEAGCWLLTDILTGTSFELHGGGPDLRQDGVWAVVWGSPSNDPTFCMQGVPFDVTSYHIVLNCDDGNPCTNDFIEPGGCVNTPVGGAEMIVVEMPELTGGYIFNTREVEVSLGFRPFEIGCVAMEWAGGIYTSTVDCSGNLQGYGGTITASFMPQPAPSVSFTEIGGEPFSVIPFDRMDVFPGDPTELVADGATGVRVRFEQIIQECYIVEPAGAVVDSAGLIVAARRMHDFDSDGQVTLSDAAEFVECMDGPNGGLGFGCLIFDGDRDENVDLIDVAAFQRAFTGP